MHEQSRYIIPGDWKNFLTMNGERPLVVTRKHPLVLISPLFLLSLTSLIAISAVFYFFSVMIQSHFFFTISTLVILNITLAAAVKILIDWYFNLYIATTRRLLEIRYTPLTSFNFYQVLLDQVKCTEVDMSKNGIVSDFIDVGTVSLTFDRPTQHEVFALSNIRHSKNIGIYLSNEFSNLGKYNSKNIDLWYKDLEEKRKFIYQEELSSA